MPLSNPFQRKCTLCGALNVTKATCPCNPDFPKNPDWDNHNWKKVCPEKKSIKPKFQSEASRDLMNFLLYSDRTPEGATKSTINAFKKAYPEFIEAYKSWEGYKGFIEEIDIDRINNMTRTQYEWLPAYGLDYIRAIVEGKEKEYKQKIIAEEFREFTDKVDKMLRAEGL